MRARPVAPRYDVVYLLDDRGWFYRYSHLHTIAASVKLGDHVKMGDAIGLLGKEGGSGGWSHLHFNISGRQPEQMGHHRRLCISVGSEPASGKPKLIASPAASFCRHLGEKVILDGSKSWSARARSRSTNGPAPTDRPRLAKNSNGRTPSRAFTARFSKSPDCRGPRGL